MVDCRLCRHHYVVYKCETKKDEDLHMCLAKEVFIDIDYLTEGPCDLYVDVDGYVPRNGDM